LLKGKSFASDRQKDGNVVADMYYFLHANLYWLESTVR